MAVLAPLAVPTAAGLVHARFTSRRDGDLSADNLGPDGATRRWRALAGVPVTWLDQRHTSIVVPVTEPGEHAAVVGDALVAHGPGRGVAVWVGDCAPIVLVAESGAFGVAHAGWRGLAHGVVGAAVDALRRTGGGRVRAWLGPCIRPCCYEFGPDDLASLRDRFGAAVEGRTAWDTAALDVPAAVRAALAAAGLSVGTGGGGGDHVDGDGDLVDTGVCTGCDGDYWSFRRRGEMGRHGAVAWREAA